MIYEYYTSLFLMFTTYYANNSIISREKKEEKHVFNF